MDLCDEQGGAPPLSRGHVRSGDREVHPGERGETGRGKELSHHQILRRRQGAGDNPSWITGTKRAKGWNNCFALPRVITLGTDGHPVQQPVPELAKLRGAHVSEKGFTGSRVLKISGDTLEINAVFEHADRGRCGLRVRRSADGERALEIRYENGTLSVFGTQVRIAPEGARREIALQVFLDRSIMEVFVGGGRTTVARVMYPPLEGRGVEAFADGRGSVDVWRMRSIWPKHAK